jgi:hypothetical protein
METPAKIVILTESRDLQWILVFIPLYSQLLDEAVILTTNGRKNPCDALVKTGFDSILPRMWKI